MVDELLERDVGMMPDEFAATLWNEDLNVIAENFSKDNGDPAINSKGLFFQIQKWKKDGKFVELVVENKKHKTKSQYPEQRVSVWVTSGMSFKEFNKGKPIPKNSNIWGACLPFSPEDKDRKEILTMVEQQLSSFWNSSGNHH